MAALDRIAHGDFSVRLPADRRHPLIELIDSVNNLAAELGDLEAQRQGFISNVSHEIQSPLTSIGGFARLLRDPSLTLEAREHYLDIIEAETRRLSKLSDNLLRLSALETGALERQRYRLDEQLRDVILLLEPQWAAKDLDLELATDPSGTEIVADRDLLCQVWINLVQNAIKFTPATGWVRVVLTPAADGWCCQVADSGPGIDPADRPHVFERFYRGDKARGGDGNGLGLALVKRVVELHSGRVDLASAPGAGTAVTVYLPLTQS
ncbi:MAG: HAMP domain-containing histidine kinase [Propionibacteriaceae bacterium]|nr:HAMP domain-containing histidine kinase [Propionibacteriaceae bacterium]